MKKFMAGLMGLLLAASVQAEMPRPVSDGSPGLSGQSDEWWAATRKAQAAQEARGGKPKAADGETNFYTGKPYDEEIDSYIFKYRNYSPALQRWTTADPSGFPDGANNYAYMAVPTEGLDPDGRLTITGVTTPNKAQQTVTYGGITYTIVAAALSIIEASSNLDGNLNINNYTTYEKGGVLGGAQLAISVSGVTAPANTEFHWVQIVESSNPIGGSSIFIDTQGDIFYDGGGAAASASFFYDGPLRSLTSATREKPVMWMADLHYVGYNTITGQITSYGGVSWGFMIYE
ncbi:MAG: hypothetical protein LBK76_11990 [Verrucomicrobiales bacterium]|jgi:RHS repeat-associated protein|nr:hypothetical protein [Verrucomicrobiales bacterium]